MSVSEVSRERGECTALLKVAALLEEVCGGGRRRRLPLEEVAALLEEVANVASPQEVEVAKATSAPVEEVLGRGCRWKRSPQ